jgi:hypothetical protein
MPHLASPSTSAWPSTKPPASSAPDPGLVRASVRLGCRCRQAAVPIAGQETESATASSSSPLSHSPHFCTHTRCM